MSEEFVSEGRRRGVEEPPKVQPHERADPRHAASVASPAVATLLSWTRSAGARVNFAYLLYFSLLAVLWTWPLAAAMSSAVPGSPGDNLYFTWLIGWFKKAIVDLHQSPLYTNLINYPEGWTLASTEATPLTGILGLPLTLMSGPVFAFNVMTIGSFILSGLAMAAAVRGVSGNAWAGAIAGTAFAFSPYRYSLILLGHINLLHTYLVPPYFLMLLVALRGKTHARRNSWGAAILLGLIGLGSLYSGYMALVVSVPLVLLIGIVTRYEKQDSRSVWKRSLGVMGLGSLFLAIAATPYLLAASEGKLPRRSLQDASLYSASPTDYLFPYTGHPVWGALVDRIDRSDWTEGALYPGVVIVVLAAIGAIRSRGASPASLTAWVWLGGAVVAVILSLGVSLHWFARPVRVDWPEGLGFLGGEEGSSVLMPAYLLYRYLPFYSSIRVSMRYAAFVQFFLGMLAGMGAASILSRLQGRKSAGLAIVLIGLVVVDFLPPPMILTSARGRTVDYWLATQPDRGAVAQLPYREANEEGQLHVFYTLIHGKPYIGVHHGSYVTGLHQRMEPVLEGFPDVESLAALRELGVGYVIVDAEWYDSLDALDDVELALEDLGVPLLARAGGELVYGLADWTKPGP